MSFPFITPHLIERVDRFQACFHAARMGGVASLPGNPLGVDTMSFGSGYGVACKARHPLLHGKNRVLGFLPDDVDVLDDMLAFYRRDSLACSLSVPYGRMTQALFHRLGQAGMWSGGTGTVPAIIPTGPADASVPSTSSDIHVRVSGPQEKELYLDLFQQAFVDRDEAAPVYRAFQWAEDALPGGVRYIAEIAGKPVGMASLPIIDGVGFFGTAGVLPEHRRRGVQMAMIRRRIGDAPSLGCDLILGGGSPRTTYYRNFERAGLRLIPTAMTWMDAGPR